MQMLAQKTGQQLKILFISLRIVILTKSGRIIKDITPTRQINLTTFYLLSASIRETSLCYIIK